MLFSAGCVVALAPLPVMEFTSPRPLITSTIRCAKSGEAFLLNAHIGPYEQAGRENPEPRRPRKLLLHRAEISRIQGKVAEKGLTMIPLRIYFKKGRAKVELGLARGKRRYDKREAIRRREQARELQRLARRGRRR